MSVTTSLCVIFSGEGEIRCVQLDMVTKWIDDFQEAKRQTDEDVVFDVLCGDFNFDNCSPGACVDSFLLFFWTCYLIFIKGCFVFMHVAYSCR